MTAILSRPQCVKLLHIEPGYKQLVLCQILFGAESRFKHLYVDMEMVSTRRLGTVSTYETKPK